MRPAKIQTSLRVRAVWPESYLGAVRVARTPLILHTDREGSDQTARMRRLIWVFDGRLCQFVTWTGYRLIRLCPISNLEDWFCLLFASNPPGRSGTVCNFVNNLRAGTILLECNCLARGRKLLFKCWSLLFWAQWVFFFLSLFFLILFTISRTEVYKHGMRVVWLYYSKNSLFPFSFHRANSAEGGETVSSGSLLFANDSFSMGPPCLNWWRSQSCVHCIDSQTITLQVDNPIQTAVVSVLLMLFTFILKAALNDISRIAHARRTTSRSTWESMEA